MASPGNASTVTSPTGHGGDNEAVADIAANCASSGRRAKEIIMPAYAATWSAAVGRAEMARAAAATLKTTPSVISLGYGGATLEEVVDEEEEMDQSTCCWGRVKCTTRRARTCVYLGCLMTMILSIELGLYFWALVSVFH